MVQFKLHIISKINFNIVTFNQIYTNLSNYHYMRNIAIFASGSGTNAENIIKYFSTKKNAKVTLVLSNKRQAMVIRKG